MLSMMEETLSALNVSECAVSLMFSQTFATPDHKILVLILDNENCSIYVVRTPLQ